MAPFWKILDPPLVILFCFSSTKFNCIKEIFTGCDEWFCTDFNVFELILKCWEDLQLISYFYLPPIKSPLKSLRLLSSEIFINYNHLSIFARSPTILNNTRPLHYLKFSSHFSAANPYLLWCCTSLDHRSGIRYRNSNGPKTLNSRLYNNPETCKEHQVIQTQRFEIPDGKHKPKWLLLREESTFLLAGFLAGGVGSAETTSLV